MKNYQFFRFFVAIITILLTGCSNTNVDNQKTAKISSTRANSYIEWNNFRISIPTNFILEKMENQYLYLSNIPQKETERVENINQALVKQEAGRSAETFRAGNLFYVKILQSPRSFAESIEEDLNYVADGVPSIPPIILRNAYGYEVEVYKNLAEYEGEQKKDVAYIKVESQLLDQLIAVSLIYSREKDKAEKEFNVLIDSIFMLSPAENKPLF